MGQRPARFERPLRVGEPPVQRRRTNGSDGWFWVIPDLPGLRCPTLKRSVIHCLKLTPRHPNMVPTSALQLVASKAKGRQGRFVQLIVYDGEGIWMKRRDLLILGGAAVAWPLAAAQQKAMPAIWFLHSGPASSNLHLVDAFRRGLADTGYAVSCNVTVEYR